MPGYTNLDAIPASGVGCVSSAKSLPYSNDVFSLVYACHVLEHFGRHEVLDVLKEWTRVLKPGGVLRVAVPSFEAALEWYKKTGNLKDVLFVFSGGQDDVYDFHKVVFDRATLGWLMDQAGLVDIGAYDWRTTDHAEHDDFSQAYLPHMDKEKGVLMSLNLEGRKPE